MILLTKRATKTTKTTKTPKKTIGGAGIVRA